MDDFIPTRAAQNKKNSEKLHDVIIFEGHKKVVNPNKIKSQIEIKNKPVDDKQKLESEMKRLRYDVIKFGLSGFEKQKARQAKVALAINLGAIPPKNRRMNYKKLMKKRKEEKNKEAKSKKFISGFSTSQSLKNENRKKLKSQSKRSKDEILESYGKLTKDKSQRKR